MGPGVPQQPATPQGTATIRPGIQEPALLNPVRPQRQPNMPQYHHAARLGPRIPRQQAIGRMQALGLPNVPQPLLMPQGANQARLPRQAQNQEAMQGEMPRDAGEGINRFPDENLPDAEN